uniref:Uncharacterized protein n=1 Tax=Anopheles stephensi TaxID=30069 RepID=A0A182YRR7_ANOST
MQTINWRFPIIFFQNMNPSAKHGLNFVTGRKIGNLRKMIYSNNFFLPSEIEVQWEEDFENIFAFICNPLTLCNDASV